ncbi:unnamed protein product [Diatraea saccharalis]|uniref:Uncharacterized protein n=1 Tax=Diatraea saccharalis TaxID=40085 RepID=A0A9N9QV03_9NEOP|nr:unnamed protein product [Diatraea saccharalis]
MEWFSDSSRRQGVWCMGRRPPFPGATPVDREPHTAHTMMYRHHIIAFYLFYTLQIVCAKINGGPRGRFVNNTQIAPTNYHVNAHHTHYSYHPPNHIAFICRYCTHPAFYPVYNSALPTYVYKFRESNDRYSVLLTGLSLYNLGRCCGQTNSNNYTPRAEEQCSIQIIDRRHFEEARFPCFIMSSFMEHNQSKFHDALSLKSNATLNDTRTTEAPITFDIVSANVDVKPFISKNMTELVVSRDQDCVIWHNMTMTKERHTLSCSLLKEYAETMRPAGVPVYIWMPSLLAVIVGIYIFSYCCCRKQKDKKEGVPLNPNSVYRYCSN